MATCFWALRARLIHACDILIAYLRGMARGGKDNLYMEGMYTAVSSEETDVDLKVEGVIPEAMRGIYTRTGPNMRFQPIGGYHLFDGDGMMHTVRLSPQGATYSNRYARTSRLAQEEAAGWPLFTKTGDAIGVGFLPQLALQWLKIKVGVMSESDGFGTANTALVYHASRLYALHEGDMPYALRVLCSGVIDTLGRDNFDGRLKHRFTAHPKVDQRTGEMFAFGYNLNEAPYVNVTTFDTKGALTNDVAVTMRRPIMMHDCAITQDYFVILDMPLFYLPERIVKDSTLPFLFDRDAGSRIGLLPRYATDESGIMWFELPSQMCFHTANAWQEDAKTVKVVACCFDEFDLDIGAEKQRTDRTIPMVWVMTLDLSTGTATRRRLAAVPGDFPTINNLYIGYKCRYMYIAHLAEWQPKSVFGFSGITKLDMWATDETTAVVAQIEFPPGFLGGEPFFVADDPAAEEDAGFLTTYVTSASGESRLMVYDAKMMDSAAVATVHIPCRVPLGFHGIHLTEQQLSTQRL